MLDKTNLATFSGRPLIQGEFAEMCKAYLLPWPKMCHYLAACGVRETANTPEIRPTSHYDKSFRSEWSNIWPHQISCDEAAEINFANFREQVVKR